MTYHPVKTTKVQQNYLKYKFQTRLAFILVIQNLKNLTNYFKIHKYIVYLTLDFLQEIKMFVTSADLPTFLLLYDLDDMLPKFILLFYL